MQALSKRACLVLFSNQNNKQLDNLPQTNENNENNLTRICHSNKAKTKQLYRASASVHTALLCRQNTLNAMGHTKKIRMPLVTHLER